MHSLESRWLVKIDEGSCLSILVAVDESRRVVPFNVPDEWLFVEQMAIWVATRNLPSHDVVWTEDFFIFLLTSAKWHTYKEESTC